MSDSSYSKFKLVGLVTGPIAFIVVLLLPTPDGMSIEGQRAAAVAVLMAIWWLTEALPLAGTALLPIALYPILGVLSASEVTREYGDYNIFLFAGGFFIAMAMQKWNLHERIALNVVVRAGTDLRRLVGGFMLATAGLSLWISNTATALMMMPIAFAVIEQFEARTSREAMRSFSTCLLLGIAYASSIGGIGTIIGTPPNLVLTAQFSRLFPEAQPIGFFNWMLVGIPLVIVFLPIVWLLLVRVLFPIGGGSAAIALDTLHNRLNELGPMSRGEKTVLTVSTLTALAWIFRADIELGQTLTIPGWSNLATTVFGVDPKFINDATVAIFFSVVLFVTPVNLRKGDFALDWEWARRIPWDVLLLFGGGLALAAGFAETQLVEWIGGRLEMLSGLHPIFLILTIALVITFVTELTSNTAVSTIVLPIIGGAAASSLGLNPLLLMIPAALSASCAFMLPVATPPNAIVFSSGRFTVADMARAGIAINLIGTVLITLLTYFVAVPAFDIVIGEVPTWAR